MIALTLLNSMAGGDFEKSLDVHGQWQLRLLDLKDSIFGKSLIDLSNDEVQQAHDLIQKRGLSVQCFSSMLFHGAVEEGEATFRQNDLGKVDRLLEIAQVLKPEVIRLVTPQTKQRKEVEDSIAYLKKECPWFIPMYQEAIDRVTTAGFKVTIENECGNCILSRPKEVLDFFEALERPGKIVFTWDVQNFWECGTFPTLEVYQQLKPVMGNYHVKGGQHDGTSLGLRWRTTLEDASWPVLEITRKVIADDICRVICLNPPHGDSKPGYDGANIVKRDIDYLRREIPEIEH